MMPCGENGFRTEIGVTDAKFTHKTAQNNLLGAQNAFYFFYIFALNMALWAVLHPRTIFSDIFVPDPSESQFWRYFGNFKILFLNKTQGVK